MNLKCIICLEYKAANPGDNRPVDRAEYLMRGYSLCEEHAINVIHGEALVEPYFK